MEAKSPDSPRIWSRWSVPMACALLLAVSGIPGRAQQDGAQSAAPVSRPETPLVSDKCPAVIAGDAISLDWYPGFEHPGVVTGIRSLYLSFGRLLQDGVSVSTRPALVLGGLHKGFSATNAWNGYFHLVVSVPRTVASGEYHLIDAVGAAAAVQEYQGPLMKMTNSPVDSRLCITVLSSRPQAQQQSNQ